MIDPGIVEAVAQQTPDAVSTLGTSLTTSAGMATLGWLFLRSKFDSISLLWKRQDEMRDAIFAMRQQIEKEISDNRLSDAKEYATRADLGRLESKIDALTNKLDTWHRDNMKGGN